MRMVTIEYESGLTMIYEGAALDEWSGTYYEALTTLVQMRTIAAQAQAARDAAETPEADETPSNVRSLREVLKGEG